jgi:DNA recombination protein RmuC
MVDPLVWVAAAAVALVAMVVIVTFAVRSAARRSEQQIAAARQELQTSLAAQNQAFSGQFSLLAQTLNQQLGQVREELQSGISSSGKLAADAQRDVSKHLQTATEAVRQMSQQLGGLQQAGSDMHQISQSLMQVLGAPKTRGTLGEIGLERLLQDALPRNSYETQYRFSTGDIVDAVVRTGERLVCIDSKFPLEAYRRIVDEGEDARKDFNTAVRKHAEAIASKYILPAEHTLDLALMFVPSESVYYELLMTEDAKGVRLDGYCRAKYVVPVSPNTLYAYLSCIAMGLRGLQIEENARRIQANLDGIGKQLETFSGVFDKLGNHIRNAQQSYNDADARLDRVRGSLQQATQGALAEPGGAEPETKTLQPTAAE